MSVAEETAAVVDRLPPGKAQSVLDFARFLADKLSDDDEWDKRLEIAHTLPKFKAFIENAELQMAEGKSIPMDMDKL